MHLEILKLTKEVDVEFAFPSSTLMIEQFQDKEFQFLTIRIARV